MKHVFVLIKILGIDKEGGVGKFLGLPKLFSRKKRDLFTFIVNRIKLRAASWSTRQLSSAGKLTKLKSVLTGIPTYSMSCFLLPVGLCNQIQSALTHFWWDSNDSTRKMCWVSWDSMTKPKSKGGLGLRDIQAFNVAMLANLSWRLVTQPDNLVARTLLGKYCHSKNFLAVTCPSAPSHRWRGILAGRDLLLLHLGKVIGNGNTTCVWTDSWISSSENIRLFGPPKEADRDLVVSDLILRGSGTWNRTRIEETFPSVAHLIYQIHPSTLNAEDIFCWHSTKSEVYSVKSGYNALISDDETLAIQPPPWQVLNWNKYIWTVDTSPKLKLSRGALPLGANLQAR